MVCSRSGEQQRTELAARRTTDLDTGTARVISARLRTAPAVHEHVPSARPEQSPFRDTSSAKDAHGQLCQSTAVARLRSGSGTAQPPTRAQERLRRVSRAARAPSRHAMSAVGSKSRARREHVGSAPRRCQPHLDSEQQLPYQQEQVETPADAAARAAAQCTPSQELIYRPLIGSGTE